MAEQGDRLSRRGVLGGMAALAGATPASAVEMPVKVARWDREFDVIVIGFGVSGAAATFEAAKAGAKVLVLDRASAAANESHGGFHYLGGGTPLQKAYRVEDSPEEMLKYLLVANGPDPDKPRITKYVERCLDNYRWMEELGVRFSADPADRCLTYSGNEVAWMGREAARPAMRGHLGANRSGNGKWLQKTLLEKTAAAGVTQLLAADAKRLVQGPDGVIEGVQAEVDGRLQSFRARRGVILATGGFAMNRDMVAQHAPDLLDNIEPIDVGANDGWGIRAGQAVGAAIRRMSSAAVYWALYPPMSRRAGILVNGQGLRFMDEGSYYGVIGHTIVRTQQGVAYMILDAEANGDAAGPRPGGVALGNVEHKVLHRGSAAEIEKALGLPAPVLQQTLELYNRFAARGDDPLFHKDRQYVRALKPPFLVLDASLKSGEFKFFTLGGLHASPDSEVLDEVGKPIPRLYAIGRTVAGIPAPNYFSSGLSLGECVCFGRLAGINAAKSKNA